MSKSNPIFPSEFLCCLSLQAGVVGSSVIGLTVAVITILINIYDTNDEDWTVQAIQYSIFGFYQALMCAAFVLIFLASFWEDSALLRVSAYILMGLMGMYVVMTIVSIIPDYNVMVYVCPGMRCPDHHWLHVDRWRRVVMVHEDHQKISPKPLFVRESKKRHGQGFPWLSPDWPNFYGNSTMNMKITVKSNLTSEKGGIFQNENEGFYSGFNNSDMKNLNQDNTNQSSEKKAVKKYRNIRNPSQMLFIIISIFYMLFYIAYLTYTILSLLSFAAQLDD